MAVTATTGTIGQVQGSLRPLDPIRDLGAIADLIEEAFAHEIDERGRAAIREMRWMARLTPLVWWWSQADPAFQDTFNGFVWEEPTPNGNGAQIVGNVSLNRTPGSYQYRIICNVVVQEAYQGQGIGRRLTEAAITQARASGAEGVVIQVHQDNPRAHRLYTDLGFWEAAGEAELLLAAVEEVSPVVAPDYRIRAWRSSHGQAVYELARQVTPSAHQWIKPVRAGHYQQGWWTRLGQQMGNLVNQQRVYRLVVLTEEHLVAMMTVTASLRQGAHHLEMLVHPEHRGQVESALVSRALYMLSALPSRPVRAMISTDHSAALAALQDSGFEERRRLLTLRRDFSRRG
jgi:GNAT superfamily N-acetyltransferase